MSDIHDPAEEAFNQGLLDNPDDEPVIGFGDNLDVPNQRLAEAQAVNEAAEAEDEELHSGEVTAQDGLSISFAGEAYETFQSLLQSLEGFGVTVTTQDGERIEGVLDGPALDDEWGDTVKVFPVDEDEGYLIVEAYRGRGDEPRRVRVGDVHVH